MIIRYAEEKNFIELRQFYDGMCKVLSGKDFLPEGDKGGFPPHKIIWLFLLYTKIIALYCHCRDTPTAVQRKDSTPTFHVMVSTGAYIGASVRHSIMVSANDNH